MKKSNNRLWLYNLLFLLILGSAGYFRLIGLDWDQSQHLHPDERFMTMVESALEPVKSLSDYFNTKISPLNPNNRGYSFYVYGDLPLVIVRYAAEAMTSLSKMVDGPAFVNWAGYDQVTLVGRVFSALSDLGSLILLFLISRKLYGEKVALLASAFSALAVMQIQESHFFTVDMFANFCMFLATFFAVEIMLFPEKNLIDEDQSVPSNPETRFIHNLQNYFHNPLFWNVIGFGLSLGAAAASKLNAAPLAILLPGAFLIRYFKQSKLPKINAEDESQPDDESEPGNDTDNAANQPQKALSLEAIFGFLVLGGVVSILAFRILMPYAFSGPSFLGVTPNPQWVSNITEQRAQAGGDVDFPPALQWARRSILFSGYNLAAWGLGWPLGLLALAGFLYMGWRILKGDWKDHLLLWAWTGLYFAWQSTQWNPTMRYQLPIYPLLALLAAWFIFNGPRFIFKKRNQNPQTLPEPAKAVNVFYFILASVVLIATIAWAYAFTRIYTRDHTRVQASHWIYQNVPGPFNLKIKQADGSTYTQPMPIPQGFVLASSAPYEVQFTAFATGELSAIYIAHAANVGNPGMVNLTVELYATPNLKTQPLAKASLTADFGVTSDSRGGDITLNLDNSVPVAVDTNYFLRFSTTGNLSISGSIPVHETSWDDGLPLRMDGYDPYGGIYEGDHNFEMYWDDNADKLNRFESNLDSGDYIFITSDRQWATTTRVPERYPLTTTYYRDLIGCPDNMDVIWCYNVANPGQFNGKLGFELVKTFTSYPEIFGIQFNTQFAEEAFTVYDAPKVLIFKKTSSYNSQTVRKLLGAVDLTHVVHVTPRQAGRFPGDLMLPGAMLAADRAGGTWSELFSYDSLQNKYPLLGLLLWYLAIGILGLFTWPILRLFLPGLSDRGYPLAKLGGLLFLAYLVWMFASLGGTYSRTTIAIAYAGIMVVGAVAFFHQRDSILNDLRTNGKYYLIVEILIAVFFLIDFAIRMGNPDLWHPARGGERPMDFSYLNAVIKSTVFPPYDPWFAGGYINYYYWGFVLVGTPIKLLGIVPSIAYNFVLPTLFAMLGIGGFCVVWNLTSGFNLKETRTFTLQLLAGLAGGAGLVLIGNLGTIQLIFHALQKMVMTNEIVDAQNVWIFQRWLWAAQGLGKMLSGIPLPIGLGEYYWAPSRVMPVGDLAITEFPLFTFIYSDLHAHMIALPLTVMAIAWSLSTLRARNLSRLAWLATIAFGGLIIGVLRPINTWDFPTYLIFGSIITGYSLFRYGSLDLLPKINLNNSIRRVLLALLGMGLLVGFAFLFFQPFAHWYGLAYTKVSLWTDNKTPIGSYWTQFGFFHFVIISWMLWETRQWMAQTPASALLKLKPYQLLIEIFFAVMTGLYLALQFILNVPIAWFVFPFAVWALILMLRPGLPDVKRLVLFMIGTGLVLTLIVEFMVLSGDIGRMNTVFKFYLQAWVLFAISSAAALGWIFYEFDEWGRVGKIVFQIICSLLLAGTILFTFTASMDKIRDRISPNIPFTLDSMTFMQYSTYQDQTNMDLKQDYLAIRWMQDNIKGSPVIVEANTPEYRWGTRFTIYTGLPGVVGWNWHERQQRALFPPEWVTNRIQEISNFYNLPDSSSIKSFLEKYDVKYIVLGQLERAIYDPTGIAKFETLNGTLWSTVYHDADTTIYEVMP